MFGIKSKQKIKELESQLTNKLREISDLNLQVKNLQSNFDDCYEGNKQLEIKLDKEIQKNKEILEYEEEKKSKVIEEIEYVTNELDNKTIKAEYELDESCISNGGVPDLERKRNALQNLIIPLLPYIHYEVKDNKIINQITI